MTESVEGDDLPADDLIVTGRRSLLEAFRCSSIRELESLLDDQYEPWVFIEDEDEAADDYLVVRIGTRGIELAFPFAVGEIWSCLDDLAAVKDFENACEELADQIETVEGFSVLVSISYDFDPSALKPHHRRRCLDSGDEVQEVGDYPYKDRMTDEASVDTWLAERFEENFPGLSIIFEALDDDHDPATPLLVIRELYESGT